MISRFCIIVSFSLFISTIPARYLSSACYFVSLLSLHYLSFSYSIYLPFPRFIILTHTHKHTRTHHNGYMSSYCLKLYYQGRGGLYEAVSTNSEELVKMLLNKGNYNQADSLWVSLQSLSLSL